jgi:hypothetical protein
MKTSLTTSQNRQKRRRKDEVLHVKRFVTDRFNFLLVMCCVELVRLLFISWVVRIRYFWGYKGTSAPQFKLHLIFLFQKTLRSIYNVRAKITAHA